MSLDLYRRESAKIIAMFKEGLPNGEVGKLTPLLHGDSQLKYYP